MLLPLSRGYETISYDENIGWFNVLKNGSIGICDKSGREIVSPGRYDFACYMPDGFILTESNFEYGACDMNGREIFPPKFEGRLAYRDGVFKYEDDYGNYVSTGYALFDFYYPVYYDYQLEKGVLPDEDNVCSFYIVRFELKPKQIVVKVINCDGSTTERKESTMETHYINPSESQLELYTDNFNLHYLYSGIDRAVMIRQQGKYEGRISFIYDVKHRDTNTHSYQQTEVSTKLNGITNMLCLGYMFEEDFHVKCMALLKEVKNYSWKHVLRE